MSVWIASGGQGKAIVTNFASSSQLVLCQVCQHLCFLSVVASCWWQRPCFGGASALVEVSTKAIKDPLTPLVLACPELGHVHVVCGDGARPNVAATSPHAPNRRSWPADDEKLAIVASPPNVKTRAPDRPSLRKSRGPASIPARPCAHPGATKAMDGDGVGGGVAHPGRKLLEPDGGLPG